MSRAKPYNRQKAISAAHKLFWRKGYHATSINDLVRELKMKPGSIYAAFSSKENLFLLTLEHHLNDNGARLVASMENDESPLTGLADALKNLVSGETESPECHVCMLTKSLLNATINDKLIAQKANEYIGVMEQRIAELFDKAKSMGELPETADASFLARQYHSDMTALTIEAQRGLSESELLRSAEARASVYLAMRTP
ncbi:MAG: TetR/AcrR family transcriptional regulator [Kordiimonadaceae bacterium]|nr:TetR/AcrR family transcriptional regulator [Kordiimonadaceae bacterium]MBO6568466.1 TetR/AcrR family transcriptional regulator [Kordiimonadaceae bacterium]MBO6963805.1 TetR/AcrR family transcriptional regulator [Kordiimonadaceae bacterium]